MTIGGGILQHTHSSAASGGTVLSALTYNNLPANLQYGAEQNLVGAAIDFAVPAGMSRVILLLKDWSTNGVAVPCIQLGDAGGIELAGYLGSSGYVAAAPGSASGTPSRFTFGMVQVAAGIYNSFIEFLLRDALTFEWHMRAHSSRIDGANAPTLSSGSKLLSQSLTTIRVTTFNDVDLYDAGTGRLLYGA